MEIKFIKMNASGNDFIVIDNRKKVMGSNAGALARHLCVRKKSVGADGLLLIGDSKVADFTMDIYNPDGSRAQMCGNGSRCAAMFAFEERICKSNMKIETLAGVLEASVKGGRVRVKLPDPHGLKLNLKIGTGGTGQEVSFINTGVPHTVVFVKNVDKVKVEEKGRALRYNAAFKPAGTNVDFVSVKGASSVYVRTYERGVEAETLSCGTGSVASAIISGIKYGLKPPVKVFTRGGEVLGVDFSSRGKKEPRGVYLEGPAELVYRGVLNGRKRR